ncbi:MAG: class I SAM-dependent rRNA methyltransferase [Acidimicrobiales bacterium]
MIPPLSLPSHLPEPPASRLAVRVTKDALRQIRGGHPWVFDASITSLSHEGEPGELAVVFGERREFVAIGLYDPASPIRVRVLHHGRPTTIDAAFWRTRLDAALARRAELVASASTTGWRLIHGENDGLPGVVIDRYDTTLVAKIYSEAWYPHLGDVLAAAVAGCAGAGLDVDRVVVRLSRQLRQGDTHGLVDGMVVLGSEPDGPVEFLENGLRFGADVIAGQKTGHFLDQRENRALVATLAQDREVLDVFACTGGFSVHAASGGAVGVTSIDLSHRSLDVAAENMARNAGLPRVAASRHELEVADAFGAMSRRVEAGERYDLVIVDPPSFAHNQRDRPGALDAYRRLATLGVELTAPRGMFVQSSCSSRVTAPEFRELVSEVVTASGRRWELRAETGHAADHPVGFAQGAYLKTMFCRLEPRRA